MRLHRSSFISSRTIENRLPTEVVSEEPVIGESYYRGVKAEIRQSSDRKRFTFIVSTETEDRHESIIKVDGIDFSRYLATNPVVLFNHRYSEVIGRTISMDVKDGKLIAVMEFDEEDEEANRIKGKVERKMLNAASIGFIIKKWSYDEENDTFIVEECELLEYSIVTVPSNPDALALERINDKQKNGGSDVGKSIKSLEKQVSELTALVKSLNAQDANPTADSTDPESTREGEERSADDTVEAELPEPVQEPAEERSEPEPEKVKQSQTTRKPAMMTIEQAMRVADDYLLRRQGKK